jgi:hypothetical protein
MMTQIPGNGTMPETATVVCLPEPSTQTVYDDPGEHTVAKSDVTGCNGPRASRAGMVMVYALTYTPEPPPRRHCPTLASRATPPGKRARRWA